MLQVSYNDLKKSSEISGEPLPQNIASANSEEKLRRNLDCAVIENLHKLNTTNPFDTVRGIFIEGEEAYPDAGFNTKNHIQLCIKSTSCIKGYFRPL